MSLSVKNYNDDLNSALEAFEHQVTDIKKETSWKIPDLENLLKSRISETKAYALVKELEGSLTAKVDQQHDRMLERLFSSFKECTTKVDTAVEFTDHRYNDTKRELLRVSTIAEAAVEKVRFAELHLEVRGLKSMVESEMD